MHTIEIIFWIAFILLFYTYIGYGLLAWLGARLQRSKRKNTNTPQVEEQEFWPELTILVAAYNEEDCIEAKIQNTINLDYPKDKMKLLFITDGSTDQTPDIIRKYPEVRLIHKDERNGKIAAVERAMKFVRTPLTLFTDANTLLNKSAAKDISLHFSNPMVGAVAGEKRVRKADNASAGGESLYWQYESFLKRMDSDWCSVVGAAGELFAIRTNLFEVLPTDTLLDDFMQTLLIAKQGYRVAYEPKAYALEAASLNLHEEMKRKIRICAGGFQSIGRLGNLINPFQYGVLAIQYLSHRVFRWSVAPVALPVLFITNLILVLSTMPFYQLAFGVQLAFYGLAIWGAIKPNRKPLFPGFYVPCYFAMMHWCAWLGAFRFFRKKQAVTWEKAERAAFILD